MFRKRVAVDLGTANTLVHVQGQGLVLNEPSVVAMDRTSRRVLAVGTTAKNYMGRTPQAIEVIRPLKDGVIADFVTAGDLIRMLLLQIIGRRALTKPDVLMCVPLHITEVERRAVTEAAMQAGAHSVRLVEEPLAAAVGAGLPVLEPQGSMVVDMGGGTTDVAVLSLRALAGSHSIKLAGDELTTCVRQYLHNTFQLQVGENMAERIKIQIGTVLPLPSPLRMTVSGKDSVSGTPKTTELTSEDLREPLANAVRPIIDTVLRVLEETPPELSGDLVRNGILLTGGGSLMRGFDELLASATKLSVRRDTEPLTTVLRGAGIMMDQMELYEDMFISVK